MTSFTQYRCPYCGKPFTEQDDIVVCPDCGTPHHRACWTAHGQCARAALHGQPDIPKPEPAEPTGSEAQPTGSTAKAASEPTKVCPRCGYRNDPNSAFCSRCGLPFYSTNANPFSGTQTQGFDPSAFDPSINFSNGANYEDIPAGDVSRLVGKNTAYYLPVFARIRAKAGSRFHFCALLFGGGWMLFRKQYRRGSIILAIQLILRALQFYTMYAMCVPLYLQLLETAGIDLTSAVALTAEQTLALSEQLMTLAPGDTFKLALPLLIGLVSLIFSIVIGACANRWYYRDTLTLARRLRAQHSGSEEVLLEEENRRGGVNLPLTICLMICAMILYYSSNYLAALLMR